MGECMWIPTDPPDLADACGRPTYGGFSYCLAHCHRAYTDFVGPDALEPSTEKMVVTNGRKPPKPTRAEKLGHRPDPFAFVYGNPPPREKPKPEPDPVPPKQVKRTPKRGNKDSRAELPKPGTKAYGIIELVLEGLTDAQIAERLGKNRNYVRSLRSKYAEPLRKEMGDVDARA